MSATFEADIKDLSYTKNGVESTAKASTAKLLLLAIADHCNDDGIAYPGLTRLEAKTCLSRQGIVDTIEALKENGYLEISGTNADSRTNIYKLNVQKINDSQATLLSIVKPLDYQIVKPLDLNHNNNHHINPLRDEVLAKPKPVRKTKKNLLDPEAVDTFKDFIRDNKKTKFSSLREAYVEPTNNNKATRNLGSGINDYSDQHRLYAEAFVEASGVTYLPRYFTAWDEAFAEWDVIGVSKKDIVSAVNLCVRKDLTVVRPQSITWALNQPKKQESKVFEPPTGEINPDRARLIQEKLERMKNDL